MVAEGGMGQVYLGYDVALERPVALKVVRPEIAALPGFSERFVREARAQAQISHSNIVQVYFVGKAEGVWFMAMELVDGGSLDAQSRTQRMPWGDAVRHFLGLAEGLREAARLGIVHRDIKPANILLDRFGLAHLADFGLALPGGSRDSQLKGGLGTPEGDRLTQVGAIMGSPPYMSPEQSRGDELDFRADLYSLGASFHELLSGVPAVPARTIAEVQAFHRTRRPAPLRDHAPDVPRGLARIIDRCLAPTPEERYPDYDTLLNDLRSAAPRPLVPARVPQRLMAWALDIAVALVVARFTVQTLPALAFIWLGLWTCVGGLLLGATPGQWLIRSHLRTPQDTEVSATRLLLRFILQYLWFLPALLAVSGIYASEMGVFTQAMALVAGVLFIIVSLGTLPSFFGRQAATLHDRLSGTRVLVDVR
jgi:hypothetical protein